jgi:sulfotransferase
MAMETAMSRRHDTSVFINNEQRRELLRGVFTGYYHQSGSKTVIFDTNRLWCARLAALAELFPQARVICCVREVPWIIDSIERQAQRNPFELSGLFDYDPNTTVYTRAARVAGTDGMVGYALDALREACFGPHAHRLVLLDYEALTKAPANAMATLYQLLGEPAFDHDYNRVAYEADVFDAGLGSPGLHRVQGQVEWRERPTILPPGLFERFIGDSFWREPHSRLKGIPTILWRSEV